MPLRIRNVFYGWWIVAAFVLISMYVGGVINISFTSIISPIINEFGWSHTHVSFAASIRGLETGLLAPLVGLLFDRLGPRRVVFTGIVLVGLGIVLLSHVNSIGAFYGAFILIAFGQSTCVGVAPQAVAGYWFQKRLRSIPSY